MSKTKLEGSSWLIKDLYYIKTSTSIALWRSVKNNSA